MENKLPAKSIRIVLILLALLALILLFPQIIRNNKTEPEEELSISNSSLSNDLMCETIYNEPVNIVWEGKIVAQMVSGTQYAIRRIPEDKEHPLFYAGQDVDKAWEEKKNVGLTGKVRIEGKWVGITAAYRNTIFDGECVPYIEIEKINNI